MGRPQDDHGAYLPSPETIRREAAAIRKGWSDAERRRREGRPPEAETPEIRIPYRRGGRHGTT